MHNINPADLRTERLIGYEVLVSVFEYSVKTWLLHFQHRNPRKLPIGSFPHDSGRTGMCRILKEIRRNSSHYSSRLSAHPNDLSSEAHGATKRQQKISKKPARCSIYQIPGVTVVFVVLVFKV
jgi:hypothetical protein